MKKSRFLTIAAVSLAAVSVALLMVQDALEPKDEIPEADSSGVHDDANYALAA